MHTKFQSGKLQGKRTLRGHNCGWKGRRLDFYEVGCDVMDLGVGSVEPSSPTHHPDDGCHVLL